MRTADGWILCNGVVGTDAEGRDRLCRRTIQRPDGSRPRGTPALCVTLHKCPRCWTRQPSPTLDPAAEGRLLPVK